MKYLWINLTKELKDMCTENYKVLKELKKKQVNGNISLIHGIEELILLKYP